MKYVFGIFIFLSFSSCSQAQKEGSSVIGAVEFQQAISKCNNPVIVDVRTPNEFKDGRIGDALNVNWNADDFDEKAKSINKEDTLFVYCLSGGRSHAAAEHLRSLGYKSVLELDGGMLKWRAANLPEVKENQSKSRPGMSLEQFNLYIASNPKVLVDFYADWCAPCRKMHPIVEDLVKDGNVQVLRIDADKNKELVEHFDMQGLPTFLMYKSGEMTWRQTGLVEKSVLKEKMN